MAQEYLDCIVLYSPIYSFNRLLVSVLAGKKEWDHFSEAQIIKDEWMDTLRNITVDLWSHAFYPRPDSNTLVMYYGQYIESHQTEEVQHILLNSQSKIIETIWFRYAFNSAQWFIEDKSIDVVLAQIACMKAMSRQDKDLTATTTLLRACVAKATQL
jgi:hypothetical protein